MAAYCGVGGLKVTCRLTACTLGSAPGRMLGNEYGRTLTLTFKGYILSNLNKEAVVLYFVTGTYIDTVK